MNTTPITGATATASAHRPRRRAVLAGIGLAVAAALAAGVLTTTGAGQHAVQAAAPAPPITPVSAVPPAAAAAASAGLGVHAIAVGRLGSGGEVTVTSPGAGQPTFEEQQSFDPGSNCRSRGGHWVVTASGGICQMPNGQNVYWNGGQVVKFCYNRWHGYPAFCI
jgi:hypothetical protein